jgi:hypothetical protein
MRRARHHAQARCAARVDARTPFDAHGVAPVAGLVWALAGAGPCASPASSEALH